MDKELYDCYVDILKKDLIPALGCTEPIAIAYAGSKVRDVMGEEPESLEVLCSGNMVKNVMGVTVPNSNGQKGIAIAAILGVVGGDSKRELGVLETVTDADIAKAVKLKDAGYCDCNLAENVPNLYILVRAKAKGHTAEVVIEDYHTNITKITKDGKTVYSAPTQQSLATEKLPDKSKLTIKGILEFANTCNLDDVRETIGRQIKYNCAIAEEGLKNSYGANVGKTFLVEGSFGDVNSKAMGMAAAGSDARMSGCSLPVVTNSGSGNQGITITLPVVEFAKYLKVSEDKLYRALVVANLTSIHQKYFIGSLSAYCGATSAACSAGVGIAYLMDMNYEQIGHVITNTICTAGGMVCDGAKPSCAAKIAMAIGNALMAVDMSKHDRYFKPGEGLVKDGVEATIESVGRMAKEGMHSTDIEILKIMLNKR